MKEKQQVGIKGPKFSANAFLGGLFLANKYIFNIPVNNVKRLTDEGSASRV